jgi:hypothetical protein
MLHHPHLPSPATCQDSGDNGRISVMDDNLRELILRLAHLDVRELVRTSVLSKQWCSLEVFPYSRLRGVPAARLDR